jgi:serine/threonine-protein kinase
MKIESGTTISHYKILSEIGKGGMGEVYLAQDTKLNRKVAIKFLSDEFSRDSEKLNRFVQEAQAASALNHPNILTVHEIGMWEDAHYIATEYIEGETLRDIIRRKESMPLNRVLRIGIQVSEALSAAHRAGIAHRDIKPENIMVRDDGYVKVLDFGLAKLTEKKKREDDISLEGETKALVKTNPGVVMGTVSYMSPEQARGQETDERTDIWSLGVVLYEMLSGRVPFSGETTNHTIVSILETEPKLLENVPDELQRIVRKTITKERENRYQTARDLLIDLKNLRRDLDIQGELERSIVPNTETEQALGETVSVQGSSGGTVIASGAMSTQNLTSTSSLEYAVTQAKSHKLATAVIAVMLIGVISAVAYVGIFRISSGGPIKSIAVLPFAGLAEDSESGYLSDGLTESIIYNLSRIPELKVLPASTVFRYKNSNLTPEGLAEKLGVQAVLVSRIIQRGKNLQISTELIDAAQNKVIWGQIYDRKLTDALAIQKEISREISEKLSLKLSGEDQEKVTKEYTANPEAYQEYLKGTYQLSKRTPDGINKAIGHFERASELDPKYAKAWSGLADAYLILPQYSDTPQAETLEKAESLAEKAIELDPDLADAHASLALGFSIGRKFAESEAEYKRAIELDPNSATAHHWYALTLSLVDRHTEALSEIRIALDLEPLSLVINRNYANLLYWAGKYKEAEVQAKKTIEMDPGFAETAGVLGKALIAQEEYREAIEVLQKPAANGDTHAIVVLGIAYALNGNETEAREQLDIVLGNDRQNPARIAMLYAALGENGKALDQLEKANDQNSNHLLFMRHEPFIKRLENEPRFRALIKKIGYPD